MNNAFRAHALATPAPYVEPVQGASRYVLRALGGFAVTLNERPIQEFGSNKARALLVYLLLERDRAHRRETLADLFWPERPARAAFNNLNQTLFTLRRALGDIDAAEPLLRSDRFTVQLSPAAPIESDVAAFQRLSALEAAPSLADELPPSLVAAAACYQGPLLHGVSLRDAPGFDEWLTVQRERLHLDAVALLQRLFGYAETCGSTEHILHYGRRLVELEPWHEPAHRAMMRVLAAGGQRRAALRQYDACRTALAVDLGVAPEPATVALAERIRSAAPRAPQALHVGERPVPACGATTHNAPIAAGAPAPVAAVAPERIFVGRAAELAVCSAFFADPEARLLTISGPGGIGKSRLALHAAQSGADDFPDGVYIIDGASAAAGASPAVRIAVALGVSPQTVVAALRTRRLLLVLDHFAPSSEGEALLNQLITAAPGVKLLATARQRLALRGERVLSLNGLATPGDGAGATAATYPAVQLFTARAAELGGTVTEADLGVIVQICRLLDGLPRSIELAAALTVSHSCAAIAELVTPASR